MKRAFVCFFLAAVAVLTMGGTANAWWNSEWSTRKKITIDTSDKGVAVAGPIGSTPVLVRLHEGNFQFTAAKDDGGDLRFVAADDKTLLKYHIERFDSLMGEAFVWVNLPDLNPGAQTSFWLYYGNSTGKAAKADDPKGTYDADTVLVYHFAGKGAPPSDYSPGGNNAQTAGLPTDGALIGGGLRLDGRTAVTIPASPSLAWPGGNAMTWSAWIKFGAPQANAVIFSRKQNGKAFVIGADNGVPYVEVANGGAPQRSTPTVKTPLTGWKHVAVVAEGTKISLCVDGELFGVLSVALPALDGPLTLGLGDSGVAEPADANAGTGFVGELDELSISKVARPAGFLKFAALSQAGEKAEKLVALGPDEQPTNMFSWMTSGTFGVILKSLTLDGWIVIIILMIMAMISWVVMFNKATYLNVVAKGNEEFMKEWRHVAADLTLLDSSDAETFRTLGGRVDKAKLKVLRNAPVYRIYNIGAEEIRHRLAADQTPGRTVLSARSIQAIRASLDGGLVRETQRLNNLIVLLTIAISGGPFLGLLGTVIGVMITFAAIAAAGDVNVNAIAPGIAAALVATVAGLVVAIPSLFGYNYLVSKIKEATSDIHVFIDEFVTKMAEFYSEQAEETSTGNH